MCVLVDIQKEDRTDASRTTFQMTRYCVCSRASAVPVAVVRLARFSASMTPTPASAARSSASASMWVRVRVRKLVPACRSPAHDGQFSMS